MDDDVRAGCPGRAVTGSAVTVGATSSTPVTGTAVALSIGITLGDQATIRLNGAGAEVKNEVKGSTTAQVTVEPDHRHQRRSRSPPGPAPRRHADTTIRPPRRR